jgi:hypothetical protein
MGGDYIAQPASPNEDFIPFDTTVNFPPEVTA